MKTFKRSAAQGDVWLLRVDALPDASELEPFQEVKGNLYTIAHSETGHDHVMERDKVDVYQRKNTKSVDLYELFMVVKEPATLEHQRSFDTHETILVPPGNYKVVRQREYIPEGFRRAAD